MDNICAQGSCSIPSYMDGWSIDINLSLFSQHWLPFSPQYANIWFAAVVHYIWCGARIVTWRSPSPRFNYGVDYRLSHLLRSPLYTRDISFSYPSIITVPSVLSTLCIGKYMWWVVTSLKRCYQEDASVRFYRLVISHQFRPSMSSHSKSPTQNNPIQRSSSVGNLRPTPEQENLRLSETML